MRTIRSQGLGVAFQITAITRDHGDDGDPTKV